MRLLNKLIVSSLPIIPKPLVGWVANRYVAGKHLQDAIQVIRNLNFQGFMATIDILGEDIRERAKALEAREAYKEVLQSIEQERIDSTLSLKLTQIGLKLDQGFCEENLRQILEVAKEKKNFVEIDMEDHTCTDPTLDIYRNVRKDFENVGVAIQAYLRRSEADVLELVKMKAKFRLCKGIYVEPESIAFKGREEIRKNFLLLLKVILANGCYVGIATHDDLLIEESNRMISELQVSRQNYEFQMLLGVRPNLRLRLIRDGHRLRVYVPYGQDWYPYSIRRLKENPQIAGYVLKSLFTRDRLK